MAKSTLNAGMKITLSHAQVIQMLGAQFPRLDVRSLTVNPDGSLEADCVEKVRTRKKSQQANTTHQVDDSSNVVDESVVSE